MPDGEQNMPLTEDMYCFNRLFPLLSSPWKIFLIITIGDNTFRFGALKRQLQTVSRVTLSKYLNELERDGFVIRAEFPSPPLRTEYSLAKIGLSVLPLLQELISWGEQQ